MYDSKFVTKSDQFITKSNVKENLFNFYLDTQQQTSTSTGEIDLAATWGRC